ncbi:MAG: acyl-CoA dehydrogenase family protein [Chloroflexi bacterium]|nr:acyl-CoA dehydrogenase family protein [Chloroflexota bacterium]
MVGLATIPVITGALATEAFAYGDLATTLAIMTPNLVAVPLMLAGTEAQKEAHLPLFCEESLPQVTAALTEPVIQFDPRKLKTTAVLDGEDYLLNGIKSFVPGQQTPKPSSFTPMKMALPKPSSCLPNAEGFEVLKREKLDGGTRLAHLPGRNWTMCASRRE